MGAILLGHNVSNSDSFIEEVSEEVRRDKLFGLFRRYGWIGIAAIVVLVGATAWNEYRAARAQTQAAAFGDALREALDTGDAVQRDQALAQIVTSGGQDVIRALAQASDPTQGKDQAIAALDGLIARSDLDPIYRDLAILRRVLILGTDLPTAERDASLVDLAVAGRPYAPLARELQALALIEAGDKAGAITALTALVSDNSAPAGLRQRATALITALGGTVTPPAEPSGG